MLCGHALAGIHRLYHDQFNRDAANNPWVVVTKSTEDGNSPRRHTTRSIGSPQQRQRPDTADGAGVICSRMCSPAM